MPRELSKCREWERDRRDRLKKGFASLSKILPCYEPSINLSKIEILQKAETYIEELQTQIKELLEEKSTKAECGTIKKLHDRVRKLIIRNEQLCNLLIDAGIRLPSEYGNVKRFRGTRIWSNRITPEQAKKLLKKEKENEQKKTKRKVQNKNKRVKNASCLSKKLVKKTETNIKQIVTTNFLQSSNFITLVTTQPCFIITNAPSTNVNQNCLTKTTTVLTNSSLFSTPLVASTVKPPLVITKSNGAINTVSSGTLLVANGSLLPVIQQPTLVPTPTIITNPAPIVVKSTPANNTTLFVVPKSDIKDISITKSPAIFTSCSKTATNSKTTNVLKSLPVLRPKTSDLTKITHINKVPISALPSKHVSDLITHVTTSLCAKNAKNKSNKNVKKEASVKNNAKGENIQTEKEVVQEKTNDEPETEKEVINTSIEKKDEMKGDTQNNENVEPTLKKQKLNSEVMQTENNDESKKVNVISAYTIDSLCNDLSDATNPVIVQADTSKRDTPDQNQKESCSIPEGKDNAEVDLEKQSDACVNSQADTTTQEKKPPEAITTSTGHIVTDDLPKDKENSNEDKTKQKEDQKNIEITNPLLHSDLSNDIFASLSHVSTGGQNPESTSPTAAFLLAFPLVSSLNSLKVTEVIEDETTESQHGTPTLLQIGTMDTTKTTQSHSDNLTPSLLNLDNFSFFSREFYPSFDPIVTSTLSVCTVVTTVTAVAPITTTKCSESKKDYTNFNVDIAENKKTSHSENQPKDNLKFTLTSITNKAPLTYLNDNKRCVNQTNAVPVCQSEVSTSFSNTNSYINCTSVDYNLSYSHSFYSTAQTVNTSSTTTVTSAKHPNEKSKAAEKKTCNYYAPTTSSYSVPQYNTFNPFTDIPKSTTYPITTKSYNEALYTNNTTYSYNYHPDNFTSTYPSTKTNIKADKLYYGLNYDNYDYKHNEFQKYDGRNQQFGNYYGQNHAQNKDKTNSETSSKENLNTNNNSKVPVNWMTTPDVRQQPQNDFIVPSLGKDVDFVPNTIYSSNSFSAPQTSYFNTNASLYSTAELHNTAPFPTIPPNSFQRNDIEENQFSWSPSKLPQLLDTTHNFVSTTLPTLVGDLALGNTQPFSDQKLENKNMKEFRAKENMRRSKPHTNYDNPSNFLSVSQLVDHNKTDTAPGRVANRRSSGNRSSKSSVGSKNIKRVSKPDKDIHNYGNNNKVADKQQIKHNTNNQEYQNQNDNNNSNWMPSNKSRNIKIPSSSYSAEALIGHQTQSDVNRPRNPQNYPMMNKSLPVPLFTDNIIPYFPMDIPQDNALSQQNQNYQSSTFSHNFSSGIQGSVYTNSSFVPNAVPITTSYLPSTNFITDLGGNADYAPILPDNTFTHVINRNSDKFLKNKPMQGEKTSDKRNIASSNNCSVNSVNTSKKSKKKQHNEPNLSNFDFSFLSMPAAINSPILPDDFHTHSNFLPPPTPTQLYPCKNPLYGKQDLTANGLLPLPTAPRAGVPHPEVSPSLNNVGTTLTNFNLSTIFPEINKVSGPMPDVYPESGKAKDYNQREFLGSTSQVPFKNLSYINSPTSTN